MVRDDNGVRARLDGELCIVGVENPFDDEWARPEAFYPLDIFPVQRGIELAAHPLRERLRARSAADIALEIAEGPAPAREQARAPAGATCHADKIAEFERGRYRKSVLEVAMALAEERQIDGQHQRAA